MIHPTLWPSPATEISIRPAAAPSDHDAQPTRPFSLEPLGVDTDDWVILFRAVIARLERIAALPPDGTPALDVLGTAVDFREGVRDCAGALRQLHTMFVHDAGRQRRHLIEQIRPFTERF
jgi:hypothetical protein